MVKDRLIEAAVAIDRSSERMTLTVLQGGIQIKIIREMDETWRFADNFTGWVEIEHAVRNPLLRTIRDLINQMNEMEGRRR